MDKPEILGVEEHCAELKDRARVQVLMILSGVETLRNDPLISNDEKGDAFNLINDYLALDQDSDS